VQFLAHVRLFIFLNKDGFLLIKKWFSFQTKTMIIIVVSLQILLPLYGILGLFAPFGLVHQWELWLVAIYHGMLLGAMQSFSRVFYSEMLPKGRYFYSYI
jgi:UMF1 family MFS transporter